MAPFESLATLEGFLRSLMERPDPLVRRLPPAPGTRAEKYAQLLNPELHPIDAMAVAVGTIAAAEAAQAADPSLSKRVETLEAEVAVLREAIAKLAAEIGAADPLSPQQSP
jgi:uncharacterized protein YceH (UPF0502 family)